MIEGPEYAYWRLAYDLTIIATAVAAIMLAGIFKGHIRSEMMRQLVGQVVPLAATVAISLLLIAPWILSAAGYGERWIRIASVIAIFAVGYVVWRISVRWLEYSECRAAAEADKTKKARQEDADYLGKRMDSVANTMVAKVAAQLNDSNGSMKRSLKSHSDSVIAAVRSVLAHMVEKEEKLENKVDAVDTRTGELQPKWEETHSGVSDMQREIKAIKTSLAAIAEMVHPDGNLEAEEHSNAATSAPGNKTPANTTKGQRIEWICGKYEEYGFETVRGQNRSNPDIVLYKEQKAAAVICIRDRAISDDANNKVKRIGKKMCVVELEYAKEYNLVFVLYVVNTKNNRQWMHVVEPGELKDWKGKSTPDILAKNDKESEQVLERQYRETVIRLGGVA